MSAKKTTDETTPAARKERAKRLTQQEVVAIFNAQGGRCWVLGTDLSGDEWSVVDGRAVSAEARRLKGQRSWDELREHILGKVESAAAEVGAAAADLKAAQAHHAEMVETFGPLLVGPKDGPASVLFAGERAKPPAEESPSPLAVEPEGGAGGRLSVTGEPAP